MADATIKLLLLQGKDISSDKSEVLKSLLCKEKLSGLIKIAKEFRIRLTVATRKQEIMNRLMCMAHIGALQQHETTDSEDSCAISYLTDDTKRVLRELPSFTSIDSWSKQLGGKLKEFTFMNLLIYLVYGREKTFDIQSLKAFRSRSLKAYKYFLMVL